MVINDFYEKGSTINYYTGRQVYVTNSGLGVLWYGLQDKTAPKLGLTDYELLNEWTSGGRVFLFSEKKPLDSFLSRHPDFNYKLLAEDGGKKIKDKLVRRPGRLASLRCVPHFSEGKARFSILHAPSLPFLLPP